MPVTLPRSSPAVTYTPHTFRIHVLDVDAVALVGDFNNWHTAAHPLVRVGPNTWERIVDLPPGRHRYAFFALTTSGGARSKVIANGSVLYVPEPSEADIRVTPHPGKRVQSAA